MFATTQIFNALLSDVVPRILIVGALSVACIAFAPQSHSQATHLHQPMSIDDTRHLLARTGIGASASDIATHQGLTREQGIQLIIQGISMEPDVPMPAWVEHPAPHYHSRVEMLDEDKRVFNQHRDAELEQLKHWWVLNMLQTSSPQTERLVLFWHDLFATNARDIGKHPLKMARQNQRFRRLGFGSWETLLKAMIRDAALLAFLDAGANHKTAPNENLARELMELFVLGEGHYDETTVKHAARALTGHDVVLLHNLEFQLKSGAQDREHKQLFGQSGSFDGDDLIKILLQQEPAARYLASRFWYAFVADSKPPEHWLADQAQRFRKSGFDLSHLYRNVLQSEAFWEEQYRGAIIKSPVDLVIGTARTLDYPMRHWQQMPKWQATIGMNLLEPPNVAGWKEGAAFVTPGHLLNRYNIVHQMTLGSVPLKTAENTMMDSNPQMLESQHSGASQVTEPSMQMHSSSDSPDMQMTAQAVTRNTMEESNTRQIRQDLSMESDAASKGQRQASAENGITASAVHLLSANQNNDNGVSRLDILLDHVDTPEKRFDTVRIAIEKKPKSPLMLKLGSYSCWPDCIDSWPKDCVWIDKHFPSRQTLSFPWLAKDDERWLSSAAYQCQFNSLSVSEKTLISSLWANLPELLLSILQTNRFATNREMWQPVVEIIEAHYTNALFEPGDTAYAMFATSVKVNNAYAPAAIDTQVFSPPVTSVNGIEQLITALSTQNLQLHQLVLPDIVLAQTIESTKSDGINRDSAGYLRAVIENPLFQLK